MNRHRRRRSTSPERGARVIAELAILAVDAALALARVASRFCNRFRRSSGSSR